MLFYVTITCNLFSLIGRCPFVGETDRATLLRVGEGTLNWDAPDVTCRSLEAQSFLHMLIQPDPEYDKYLAVVHTCTSISSQRNLQSLYMYDKRL